MEHSETPKSPLIDTLKVSENDDGSFTMEWDPDDPLWSWLNTMTEDEITEIIHNYAKEVLQNEKIDSIITNDSLTPD